MGGWRIDWMQRYIAPKTNTGCDYIYIINTPMAMPKDGGGGGGGLWRGNYSIIKIAKERRDIIHRLMRHRRSYSH